MRILLVGNPISGGGRGTARTREVEGSLKRAGARVDVLMTTEPGHAAQALASPPGDVDRVVACGGDGLVQEAASALAGGDLPLAIIPAGRGNDFARGLRVPLDTRLAAYLAVAGPVRRVDLGLANGRRFCTIAACGVDSQVARAAHESRLPLPGPTIYVAELLKALARGLSAFTVRGTIDGRPLEDALIVLAVANAPTYGGGFRIAPSARLDDGRLDACLIRNASRLRALRLFPSVFAGRHEGLPEVSLVAFEELRVETTPVMPIDADGEPLATMPCTYAVERAALPVVSVA